MATTTTPTRRTRFSRRIPDHVTDELVAVLTTKRVFEFNELFGLVYENLKKRNAVSGGEEMLRLRAYEKLQNLVGRRLVAKVGKTYQGLDGVENAVVPLPPRPAIIPLAQRLAQAEAAREAAEEANRLKEAQAAAEAEAKAKAKAEAEAKAKAKADAEAKAKAAKLIKAIKAVKPTAKAPAKKPAAKPAVKAKTPAKKPAAKPLAKAASAKASVKTKVTSAKPKAKKK